MPEQNKRKLDARSQTMILVGHHCTGAYKLFDPVNRRVIVSNDVIVDEGKRAELQFYCGGQNPVRMS